MCNVMRCDDVMMRWNEKYAIFSHKLISGQPFKSLTAFLFFVTIKIDQRSLLSYYSNLSDMRFYKRSVLPAIPEV